MQLKSQWIFFYDIFYIYALWPRIKDTNDYFQQDGAPPHYGRIVRDVFSY